MPPSEKYEKYCHGCLQYKDDVREITYKENKIAQICGSCYEVFERAMSLILSHLQRIGEKPSLYMHLIQAKGSSADGSYVLVMAKTLHQHNLIRASAHRISTSLFPPPPSARKGKN